LCGKAQRYWDGTDWTDNVRTSGGQEAVSRLRPPDPHPSRPAQADPVGPTVAQVLAEWDSGSPAADLSRWREGIARYDAASLENRVEMRASAELMCAALTNYLRGNDIFTGSPHTAGALAQTIWNVLVASLLGNDQSTWDAQVERHVRLALAAARHAGLQPESLGAAALSTGSSRTGKSDGDARRHCGTSQDPAPSRLRCATGSRLMLFDSR
jgi:hypothetical protein